MRFKLSGVALLSCILLAGCGFRLDMHVQPKMKPLRADTFFANGMGSRPIPPNTIARGHLHQDAYFYTGMMNGKEGDVMPFPVTEEILKRGQQRFNIYCSPCHSELGDGNGMIVQRGYQRPPSYLDPKLVNAPIGHFFDVMTNGFGKMPDYAAQVAPYDRWAIAAYIRALQLSQHAPAALAAGKPMDQPTREITGTPGTGATQPPKEQPMERK
jgi:mono/diheme cytochrome c family protein